MKKIKTILFLIPVLAFAACSEDTEMTTYSGRANEAFFDNTKYSYVVSADLEDAYSVDVKRATPVGNASVPVTVTVEDAALASAFTAPATVDFVDGEYAAKFKVSFDRSKLTIGKANVVSVALQSETNLPYKTACSLVVTRDYTWKAYKTGTYSSFVLLKMFGSAMTWEQPIEQAAENTQLYRLPQVYHNAGTKYSEAGYDLQFTWDGSATIGFTAEADADGCVTIESGWSHPSYGMVSLYIDTAANYSNYDSATKTFTFNLCAMVSLGQLTAWGDDTFVLND